MDGCFLPEHLGSRDVQAKNPLVDNILMLFPPSDHILSPLNRDALLAGCYPAAFFHSWLENEAAKHLLFVPASQPCAPHTISCHQLGSAVSGKPRAVSAVLALTFP